MCGHCFIAEEDSMEELMEIIEVVNQRSTSGKVDGETRQTDATPILANTSALKNGAYAILLDALFPDRCQSLWQRVDCPEEALSASPALHALSEQGVAAPVGQVTLRQSFT